MQVVVLADANSREELLAQGINGSLELKWLTTIEELDKTATADAVIDLLFEPDPKRIELLKSIFPQPVIVNSVTTTLKHFPDNFIRFNGWPTFLKRTVAEASYKNDIAKKKVEELFSYFKRKVDWVPDQPGFITARVVAMIINEAYFALEENVSSKNEIDVAMKLGTNYPYGPFEWAEKIGIKKIVTLLNELSRMNKRFEPAEWLKKESQS